MPDRWSRRKSAAIKPIDAVGKRGGETGPGVNGLCFVGQVMGRKEQREIAVSNIIWISASSLARPFPRARSEQT
jgi:hypothetical protein